MIPARFPDLTGRVPVGAVLRIGRKDPKRGGVPIESDRFYVVSPDESELKVSRRDGKDVDVGQRLELPEFKWFNDRSRDKPITTVRGFLAHATEPECWSYNYRAQVLPGKQSEKEGGGKWPVSPSRRPACVSEDGTTASRLFSIGEDGTEERREIRCPGRMCEFQQSQPQACKFWGRLYFMPRWKDENDDRPVPLMKWSTTSWNSGLNVIGFFDYIHKQLEHMGHADYSLVGLPFILTLGRRKKAGHVFPVVRVTPEGDLSDWRVWQVQQIEKLGGGSVHLLSSARTEDEADPAVVDADYRDVTVPGEQASLELE